MTDRHKNQFCFGPTHEEVVTELMGHELKSYKQLPVCVYQIHTKFRDEIRPRFGVMRSREFIMKDAYSFHLDMPSLQKTYETMYAAYSRIFERLGFQYRAVAADTGAIGGDASHEFHALADSGEDCLAYSQNSTFAANLELCACVPEPYHRAPPHGKRHLVQTPGITSVSEQAAYLSVPESHILKTLLVKGKTHPVVGILVRGDYTVNPAKAEKHPLIHRPLTLIDEAHLASIVDCTPGFIGPIGLNIPLVADHSVRNMANFCAGANQTDNHYNAINIGIDFSEPDYADLRFALEGEPSPDGSGPLHFCRGIELGHIFQLKDKYSTAMGATVLDETGRSVPMQMGCYGIGVSRIVAASIEQHHDEKGIVWPESIAPFLVAIIPLNAHKSSTVKEISETLYQTLLGLSVETVLDDRNERPGVKFADMELIGIPWHVVIGDKGLEKGIVELKSRANNTVEEVSVADIVSRLQGCLA
jgi:prolyl-tRNA synthetase